MFLLSGVYAGVICVLVGENAFIPLGRAYVL